MDSEKKVAKCIKCGRLATTKIVKIIKGKAVDLFLCDEHAEAFSPHLQKPAKSSLVDIIQHFLKQQGAAAGIEPIVADTRTCPCCGLAFSAYRKTLLLGCSECYGAFEKELLGDLRKMHGVTAHEPDFDEFEDEPTNEPVDVGKPPETQETAEAGSQMPASDSFVSFTEDPSIQIMQLNEAAAPIKERGSVLSFEQLKEKMTSAIEEEDFEQAARIRDTIRLLQSVAPEGDLRCSKCKAAMTKFIHDSTGLYQVCSHYPSCPHMRLLDIQPEARSDEQ